MQVELIYPVVAVKAVVGDNGAVDRSDGRIGELDVQTRERASRRALGAAEVALCARKAVQSATNAAGFG